MAEHQGRCAAGGDGCSALHCDVLARRLGAAETLLVDKPFAEQAGPQDGSSLAACACHAAGGDWHLALGCDVLARWLGFSETLLVDKPSGEQAGVRDIRACL